MNHRMHPFKSGFTIVELLIVIVIIGILAAIILIAYTGIKSQGYNAQITQGVDQYSRAIESYKGLNGSYPKVTGEDGITPGIFLTCLGTGYPNAQCGTVTGVTIIEDSLFNTAIKGVINSVPLIGKNVISGAGETFIGAVYGIDQIDIRLHPGTTNYGRIIDYALMGRNVSCGVAGAYQYNVGDNSQPAVTICEIYLEKYPK